MTAPATSYLLRSNDFPDGIKTSMDVQRLGAVLNPMLAKLKNLGARGVNLTQNVDGQVVSFQVQTPASDWTDFTPATWTNAGGLYPNFGWRVDQSGVGWLRGRIATLPALATVLATLPAAAAPLGTRRFTVDAAGAYGAIEVAANGQITQVVGSIAGTLDFDGAFPTANNSPSVSGASAGVAAPFPVLVRISDRRKPLAVLLLSVQDHSLGNPSNTPNSGTTTPSILAPGLQWSAVGSSPNLPNLISVDGIPGLALGRTYDVQLLVLYA
jgi:hypothetical protein